MGRGARTIHAHREPGEASILEPHNYVPCQQWRSAWRQRYANVRRTSVSDQLNRSGRLMGSPPVSTKTGTCKAAI
jgi:hypothetical protein